MFQAGNARYLQSLYRGHLGRELYREALVEAENTRIWTQPLTVKYEDADIEDAYAVGQIVTDMKVANGRVIKGHKVGLTSKAMRSLTGATEPDYGTLLDNWFLDEGSRVSMSTMNRPLVEIELVFVASTAPGFATRSISAKMRFFRSMFSKTASIQTSASPPSA